MKTVKSVYEAKSHLSGILSEVVNKGAAFVICKHGVPIADIVPHQSTNNPFEVREDLKGAEYLVNPTASLDEDDWPEDLR